MKKGDKVDIYLHWGDGRAIQGQGRPPKTVLRVEGDVAIFADEFAESGEARFSTTTGRRLKSDSDEPTPWDSFRMRI